MEELKSYLCKNSRDRLILAAMGAVFGIAGVVLILRREGGMSIVITVAALAACAILEYEALTAASREKKILAQLEDSGVLSQAAAEFGEAESFAGDTLRLGKTFLFRKKNTMLLQYRVIREICTEERSQENSGTELVIFAKLSDGSTQKLCSLDSNYAEAAAIAECIRAHDPEIAVR